MKLSEVGPIIREQRLNLPRSDKKGAAIYVAKKLGISKQHYLRIEMGKALPGFALLKKMGKIFNFSVDDIEA